jgi:hypothetical protein
MRPRERLQSASKGLLVGIDLRAAAFLRDQRPDDPEEVPDPMVQLAKQELALLLDLPGLGDVLDDDDGVLDRAGSVDGRRACAQPAVLPVDLRPEIDAGRHDVPAQRALAGPVSRVDPVDRVPAHGLFRITGGDQPG